MKVNFFISCLFISMTVFILACNGKDTQDADLAVCDSLLQAAPDSAFHLLEHIQSEGQKLPVDTYMHIILMKIDAKNKAFVPLSAEDLKELAPVVNYYENAGIPELLARAYYLTGSVYRDLSNVPMSLEYLHKTEEVAVSTEGFGDKRLLFNARNELIDLYRRQSLFDRALEKGALLEADALSARDTVKALDAQFAQLATHDVLDHSEYVATHTPALVQSYLAMGDTLAAAQSSILSVFANLKLGNSQEAKDALAFYERSSGFIDGNFHAMPGHEIYYYVKGLCLMSDGDLAGAEAFFRRELATTTDWNNRGAAYDGLSMLYDRLGRQDSALRYSRLQCEALDSDYCEKLSRSTVQMAALYDYSLHKNLSMKNALALERQKRHNLVLLLLAILCFVGGGVAFLAVIRLLRQRMVRLQRADEARANTELARREAEAERDKAEAERDKAQKDFTEKTAAFERERQVRIDTEKHLRAVTQAKEAAEKQIEKMEKAATARDMEKLKIENEMLKDQVWSHAVISPDQRFQYMVNQVKDNIAKGQDSSHIDMAVAYDYAEMRYPGFIDNIRKAVPVITKQELDVCVLLSLGCELYIIREIVGLRDSGLSNIRTRLYSKAHDGSRVSVKEADRWILSLTRGST